MSTNGLTYLYLKFHFESDIWISNSFENDIEMYLQFTNYLRVDSCRLNSGQHFSLKYFPKDTFVGEI